MGFSNNIAFLEGHLKSREAEDYASLKLLTETHRMGYSLLLPGAVLTAAVSYNFAVSTGQKELETAYQEFTFPSERQDVAIPEPDSLMYPFVSKAIEHQAPHALTQDIKLENGIFKLSEVPADRKKINVEQLNTEIRQSVSEAIADYNYGYYLGIGSGITMTLAGAFLVASAHKTVHKLKTRYESSQAEITPTPNI